MYARCFYDFSITYLFHHFILIYELLLFRLFNNSNGLLMLFLILLIEDLLFERNSCVDSRWLRRRSVRILLFFTRGQYKSELWCFHVMESGSASCISGFSVYFRFIIFWWSMSVSTFVRAAFWLNIVKHFRIRPSFR